MSRNGLIDEIDKRILKQLQQDARITYTALAKQVNLSKTPCIERVKRLIQSGVIRRFNCQLDAEQLQQAHIAFVEVKLSSTSSEVLQAFNRAIQGIPQVQSCHMVSGGFDYLLKVRTKDMSEYRQLLGNQLAHLPAVQQTSTYVAMEEVKDNTDVPIE